MNALQKRVQRGIAQLDHYAPTWREKVNMERLDMGSSRDGLLEQMFGDYKQGLRFLGLHVDDGYSYGFDISGSDGNDKDNVAKWAELTAAWKTVLGEKREGASDGH